MLPGATVRLEFADTPGQADGPEWYHALGYRKAGNRTSLVAGWPL